MSESYPVATSLGPLEALLRDPAISEIFVDNPQRIAIVRAGKLEDVDAHFDDEQHLIEVVRAIVAPLGLRFDESNPLLEARLFDGSRISAVCAPIALDGSTLVISKARKDTLSADDLVRFGAWNAEIVAFLRACVAGRMSIVLAGNHNSGKTTVMNLLCDMIPEGERVITVEELGELALRRRRLVRLETRPANLQGRGAVTLPDLVRQALRMYPERLIVGELRGAEAWPLLQAINNGHQGCMATTFATSPRDALARLEIMATSADPSVPLLNVREQIVSAIDVVLQMSRLADGRRRLTHVTAVERLEREAIVLEDLYTYIEGSPEDARGSQGQFVAGKQLPAFVLKLRQRGVEIPP